MRCPGLPAAAVFDDESVRGQAGQDAVQIVLPDPHLLGDLGNRDAGVLLDQRERFGPTGAAAPSAGRAARCALRRACAPVPPSYVRAYVVSPPWRASMAARDRALLPRRQGAGTRTKSSPIRRRPRDALALHALSLHQAGQDVCFCMHAQNAGFRARGHFRQWRNRCGGGSIETGSFAGRTRGWRIGRSLSVLSGLPPSSARPRAGCADGPVGSRRSAPGTRGAAWAAA